MATNSKIDTLDNNQMCNQRLALPGGEGYRHARVAAGLISAAHNAGIELNRSYADTVATHGLAQCGQLGVTNLGNGVVIHTAPENPSELPVVLGYADETGEWLPDGNRHDPADRIR
jgi:hypothetical protein